MLPDVKYLILDFETRNVEDLAEVGLDNYSRSAEPVLLSWKLTGGVWNLWRIYKEPMPQQLREVLLDPTVIKVAWNAQFERVIFKNAPMFDGQFNIPINQWRDPMILARSLSMPGALEKVCAILKMGPDEAKFEGNWIELFCQPRRKKKKDPPGMGVYNDWNSHPKSGLNSRSTAYATVRSRKISGSSFCPSHFLKSSGKIIGWTRRLTNSVCP